jgi:cobyrinic acid a,c-diamide synthase
MVMGYQRFQPDINIAAVVLNNVSGSRHERKLRTAVERYCGIPVVGSISRDPGIHIDERHLGLIPFAENDRAEPILERIYRKLDPHLDVSSIIGLAGGFETGRAKNADNIRSNTERPKIGVMLDSVFNFYYPENFEALRLAGADLVFIDSLKDHLPEIDGLYIGGGFPEFFLKGLETNYRLREQIAVTVEHGMPVYAECAGLMYLCRGIWWRGQFHKMVGVIPAEVELSERPQGHGYVVAEVVERNPFFPVGVTLRGHEFHHSKLTNSSDLEFAYKIRRGRGINGEMDGIVYKNVFAAYTHLHALGTSEWAGAFISMASRVAGKPRSSPLTLSN